MMLGIGGSVFFCESDNGECETQTDLSLRERESFSGAHHDDATKSFFSKCGPVARVIIGTIATRGRSR